MNANEIPADKKSDIREIIKCTAALLIICAAATAALSITNSVTKERIANVEEEQADAARRKVCPDAEDFELCEADEGTSIYMALAENGDGLGYAISTTDKSYGGDISVMTGIDMDGTITGVEILSINDTPGLGMKAKDDAFRNQYPGKTGGSLTVSKNASGDEIQAITGATKTSEAVTRCVNKASSLIFGKNDSEGKEADDNGK